MFDYCTCSQDEEHVEDVASDDVADGYVVVVLECRHDGCCQFWQRGSERYDGQTDDEVAYTLAFGEFGCAIYKPVCAFDQKH